MLISKIEHRPAQQNKPTIVTVNGWTCKTKDWNCLEPLCDSGIGLFRFDRRGYVPGYFRTLVSELAEELAVRGIKNPHLVVHSMGGLTAIAYLNLVKEPRYEDVRPSSVTFVTPVLGDPRDSFPKDGGILKLASAFTRWRSDRVVSALQNGDMSFRHMWVTLTAFQLASPLLLSYMGADDKVRREFSRFLSETKVSDRHTTLMEFYAMCTEGKGLGELFNGVGLWVPEKVMLVGGEHDLFVDNGGVAIRMTQVLNHHTDLTLRTIDGSGHFPMLEFPERFRELIAKIT